MPRVLVAPILPPFAFVLLLSLALSDSSQAQVCSSQPVSALHAGYSVAGDKIGFDVSAAGSLGVVGRPGSHEGRGSVVTLRRDGKTWVASGLILDAANPAGSNLGFSVSTDGNLMAIGAPFDGPAGSSQSGSVYVYQRLFGGWVFVTKLLGEDAFSLFGFDVAVSAERLVASDLSIGEEKVRVFRLVGSDMVEEVNLVAPGGGPGVLFGLSVAMSGERIAVGAPLADIAGSDSGAVYVFERGSGDWSTVHLVVPTTQLAGSRFGSSVALQGDRLVVGSPRADVPSNDAGRAGVFRFEGGSWVEETTLLANDNWVQFQTGSGDLFGWSVAIDGDAIVVGAPGKDDKGTDAGATYVYTLNGGEWTLQQKYVAPGSVLEAEFGYSVAVSGDDAFGGRPVPSVTGSLGAAFVMPCFRESAKFPRESPLDGGSFGLSASAWGETVLVGAPHSGLGEENDNFGSASVWVPNGTAWTHEADLVPADAARHTLYGFDLALSGDVAAVGSPGARVDGVVRGAVYVFARDSGAWTEERKVVPAGIGSTDGYGLVVALDGDTLAAGAALDDDMGTNSGSAYVFTRSGGAWPLEQQLFPDVISPYGRFGSSIAVSGDTIVVGAPHDEFGQPGFGAAYVFTRSAGVWSFEAKLEHPTPFVGDRFGSSVAASGDTIAVVAPGQGGILVTFVYSRAGGWVVEAALEQDVVMEGSAIHAELSLEGDLLAVSTYGEIASPGLGRGFVTLYVRSDGVWQARQVIASNENNLSDFFGWSVSIAGGGSAFVAIGDLEKFGRVNGEGAVYAYRLDRIPPVITCPADVVVKANNGGEAVVGFQARATDDYDLTPSIVCSPPSGTSFPMGSTTVTCRATDGMDNESTCEFDVHVLPDELFYRRGNVNALTEEVVDVLFVNDSPGDLLERKVLLSAADPLVMCVIAPPSRGRLVTRLAMYVWLREPTADTVRELPFGIGFSCLPTPLDPGGPQPKRIANSLGYAGLLGAENWPGPPTSPAPTVLLSLPSVGRSLILFAQGLIVDSESPNGEVAVTNGVLVEVSD